MYGSKIASIRLARGYTQEYLAQKLGIAQNTYSKMEKNEKIDEDMLAKIAEVLGVSAEDIKSPTPIVMNFHNSPNSYGQVNGQTNNMDVSVIEMLKQQLQQKDEQITKLLALLEKK